MVSLYARTRFLDARTGVLVLVAFFNVACEKFSLSDALLSLITHSTVGGHTLIVRDYMNFQAQETLVLFKMDSL